MSRREKGDGAIPVEIHDEEKRKKQQRHQQQEIREKDIETSGAKSYLSLVMPAEATPILVIALIEAIESMGSRVKFSSLLKRFRPENSANFLSALKVAEELGLVKIGRTEAILTDLGAGFVRASDGKARIIRAGLAKIEPFRTSLELLSVKRSVSAREIAGHLSMAGINSDTIQSILIEWGISSGLLRYNGASRNFELA
ncbi:MAG TPA: AAA-associated domain-containing protein [Nitrososphaerales archaeon]|nr:AAA-associated domain-containing protein [Nitrososphaerales archaeon]